MPHAFQTRPAAALAGRDTAFVVHLATDPAEPTAGARGRVEHVSTGSVARFESVEDLVRFMQQTLAAIVASGR